MSFPLNYRATMTMAADVAMDKNEPGYVRARVLCTLIRELSPLNERHAEVKRELGIEEASVPVLIDVEAESRAYLKGVRDGMAAARGEAVEEEDGDEGDEDSGGADEDEPP
jgi:uncharacterized protein YpuA (DUF1002 family)